MPLSPSTRSSIEALWTRFGVEAAHARQVAGLAMHLFDATREAFGIPGEDRDRLEAACLLHDLGYGIDARRHGEAGARAVMRHGLEGLPAETVRWIAAVIRVHPGALTYRQAEAIVGRVPDARGRLFCAALLRIADSLDGCHLQDASIVSVRMMRRKIRIGVRPGRFAGGAAEAQRRCAQWRDAFPVDIEVRATAGSPPDLLDRSHSINEAMRRLLSFNHRVMVANVGAAREGGTDEALHDLRIAIRRMRTVFRAFRGRLARTSAGRIDEDLRELNRILGIARDLDVWVGIFSGKPVASQFTSHRLWPRFLAHQIEMRRMQQATVRRQLHGAHFAALQLRIARFLRLELPAQAALEPPTPLAGPARRAVAKSLKQALKLGRHRQSESPEKRHRLRIALRRLRYLGAFFEPVLGGSVRRLIRRAHAVERMLGEMRDADLVLGRIVREGPPPPRLLVRQLERLRGADSAALDAAWGRLEEPGLLRDLRRELKKS